MSGMFSIAALMLGFVIILEVIIAVLRFIIG